METLATVSTDKFERFSSQESEEDQPKRGNTFSAEQREAGKLVRLEKLALWATLDTRQAFVDERYMRSIVQAAGLNCPMRNEPASVARLRSLLRRIDIGGVETREAIGLSIEQFLVLNPNLPLWAALSMVLELTGKFDDKAAILAQETAEI